MAIDARVRPTKTPNCGAFCPGHRRTSALHRPQRPSQSLHNHPRTNTRRSGQFPKPQQTARGNRSPCVPGSDRWLPRDPAGPRTRPFGMAGRLVSVQLTSVGGSANSAKIAAAQRAALRKGAAPAPAVPIASPATRPGSLSTAPYGEGARKPAAVFRRPSKDA